MIIKLRRQQQILTIMITIITALVLGTSISAVNLPLKDEPLVREKTPGALSDRVIERLTERDGQIVKVWVFFTDKGVFDRAGFVAKASAVTLTERALRRRAKVGLDKVVFVDLPVTKSYVSRITDLGTEHRRSSRWLNAASFEIPVEMLDQIDGLPFVAYLRPVATFRGHEDAEVDLRETTPLEALVPADLQYGDSYGQLAQINVPAVHQQGYTGQGVTLTIMDTGYRKSHTSFAAHYAAARVLAEWDFVQNDGNTANEGDDPSSQWNHGTYIWSTSAGEDNGNIYGPAYRANIILCKTEDVSSETPVEEDNWVAALEFADSVGTDVITSSLCYSNWYFYEDFDGQTATISIAAGTCDGLGIVLCNAMGNSGPAPGTLLAPADAFDMLSIGAVNNYGYIAGFSSRGPTYDGRMKPDVCAQGVSTRCASASGDDLYTNVNGTSLSTPLAAGAACLLIEARSSFSPALIREALRATASQSDNPDNTYGWGIINLEAALSWGAEFSADITIGEAPLTIQFTEESSLDPTEWHWDFGDGDTSILTNPAHIYEEPGFYDVTLTVQTPMGEISGTQVGLIKALGDTLRFVTDSVYAGSTMVQTVSLRNSQPLNSILIPFRYEESPIGLSYDSVTLGSRTSYFESMTLVTYNPLENRYTYNLKADDGGGAEPLPPGDGEVLKIYFSTNRYTLGGLSSVVDSGINSGYITELTSDFMSYPPVVYGGTAVTKQIQRGDADYSNDGEIDIGDLTYLINFLFIQGDPPITLQSGDLNGDFLIDIEDINYMILYLFLQGDPPISP